MPRRAHPLTGANVRTVAAALALHRRRIIELREADVWRKTARPNQIAPDGDWTTWLIMAGRGFGKTRSGAEWIREEVMAGRMRRVALVGSTAADVRDVMIEGESGLLACCERYGFPARYQTSRRRIVFGNGAIATAYSAEEPNRLRGPQHDGAWADEVAAWGDPDTWDQLQFGLRLVPPGGGNPRQVVTTTPKPVTVVRAIMALKGLEVSRGTTFENRDNLADAFFERIIDRYAGTKLGRQELEGILLEELEGALWTIAMIDKGRLPALDLDDVTQRPKVEKLNLVRIVVAIDPATTYGEGSDETAIAVVGRDRKGDAYLLESWSGRVPPAEWGERLVRTYDRWQANTIVAESNQGGEMIREVIRGAARSMALRPAKDPARRTGPMPPVRLIHAKRGKVVRAEPVSALYEQGRVHHVGSHGAFEDQMVLFPVANDDADDRVDALVHGVMEVSIGRSKQLRAA